jgi:hypothetical protein
MGLVKRYADLFSTAAMLLASLVCCGCDGAAEPLKAASVAQPAPDDDVVLPSDNQPAAPRLLQWDEIDLPLGAAEKFQPWMLSTAVQALDGRTVRISGYMYGDVFQPTNIREFKLVRHVDCEFGAVGHPAHLIFIELGGKLRTSFTTELVTVEGTFHIRPFTGPDGRTWALYHMDVTKIERGEA